MYISCLWAGIILLAPACMLLVWRLIAEISYRKATRDDFLDTCGENKDLRRKITNFDAQFAVAVRDNVGLLKSIAALESQNERLSARLAAYAAAEAEQKTLAAWRKNLQVGSVAVYGDYVLRIKRIYVGEGGKIACLSYPNRTGNGTTPRTVKVERLTPIE